MAAAAHLNRSSRWRASLLGASPRRVTLYAQGSQTCTHSRLETYYSQSPTASRLGTCYAQRAGGEAAVTCYSQHTRNLLIKVTYHLQAHNLLLTTHRWRGSLPRAPGCTSGARPRLTGPPRDQNCSISRTCPPQKQRDWMGPPRDEWTGPPRDAQRRGRFCI